MFKLVVKGELLAGRDVEAVRTNIAELFHLAPEAEQLDKIFSGRPIVVKKGLDQAQAEQYKAMIQAAGLGCEVVAEQAAEIAAAAPEAEPVSTPAQPAQAEAAGAAEYNPYRQPEADLEVACEPGEFALVEPQKLSAGAGWGWFKEGYFYFKQSAGLWVGAIVVFWVIVMVLSLIPLVSILVNLIMPVFVGGFMLACYKQFQGEGFSLGDVFAGFKTNLGGLLAVGGLYLLGMIVVIAVFMGLMFAQVGGPGNIAAIAPESGIPVSMPLPMALIFLVMLALMIPLMAAYWFAPALVMLNELSAVQAMRLSLKGCLRNWLAFLLYGLIGLVFAIVATIPLALGWLVLGPVMMGSMFAAYRQIYTDTQLEP
ncbi:hypothetical protein Tel_05225 [Candidatus Tenderia electrophaga]|jgi:uncharacterized membrane protein|uniref:Uncharacterized protein n=1 Tax=Candidatus Tenderia electrophaga TaxID=1748243 RepID=A0A0S2TBX0_9GAMM|nr:hypothetical protein Tel_05225 [Candidatus Tenderia electrophaga]